MRIQISTDKNTVKMAAIISAILCIICIIALLVYMNRISSFVKVEAIIVDKKNVYDNQNTDNQNRNRYIQYSYEFNGQKYNSSKLVLFYGWHKIGDTATIRVNPSNPAEMSNSLYPTIYIATILLCAFILTLLIFNKG